MNNDNNINIFGRFKNEASLIKAEKTVKIGIGILCLILAITVIFMYV